MTLDEAIKHCLERAEENDNCADKCEAVYGEDNGIIEACRECAADHRQLAEWLTELRDRQWVSCKDKMPEDRTLVLFCYVNEKGLKSVHYGYHFNINGITAWAKPSGGLNYCDEEITHWQPLPEPPKED